MAIKVRCPQCNKLAQFGDGDGGLTALCIACGGRFTIPLQSTAADDVPAPVGPGALAALGDGPPIRFPAAAPAPTPPPLPVPAPALAGPVPGGPSIPALPPVPPPTAFSSPNLAPSTPAMPPAGAPSVPALPFPPTTRSIEALANGTPIVAGITQTAPPPMAGSIGPTLPQPAVSPGGVLIPGKGDRAVIAPESAEAHGGGGGHAKLVWAVVAATLVIAGVMVAVLVSALRPSWEQEHAADIRQMKTTADRLAAQHNVREAYETYRQIGERTIGRKIEDPLLRADVAEAIRRRDELFDEVFRKAESGAAKPGPTAAPTRPPEATAIVPPPQPQPTESLAIDASEPAGVGALEGIAAAIDATAPRVGPTASSAVAVAPRPAGPKPPITVRTPAERGANAPPRPNFARRRLAPGDTVTDEEIGRAIQSSVDFLLSEFRDGMLHGGPDMGRKGDAHYAGTDALCVYALLQASMAIKDDRLNPKGPLMRTMIEKMKNLPMEQGPVVYARAIRATALALLNRPEDREALKLDVGYLVNGHMNGGYTYTARAGPVSGPMAGFEGDNSNSQYGLLGVWSGAEVGIEVNNSYWQAVDGHWARCQYDDGEWGYSGGGRGFGRGGRLSMTLAGIASMYVTHDYLDGPKYGVNTGRDPFSAPLKKGLDYLETGDNAIQVNNGYTLYGLERVGLASGFKFFGDHDWYKEMARYAISTQRNGAWPGAYGVEVNTAYHLLFLARGRHPILMNKLRFEGSWANRPRDVANLAKFATKELERPLNWQVVPAARDWTDWTDSPILYISSHIPIKFTDAEVDKIRKFVQAGGLLYTQADGNGLPANKGFEDLAKRLFPAYELQDLPTDHPIYNIQFKPSQRPRLRYVNNGVRALMVHSPTDISASWQLRQEKSKRYLYELGVNLFLYASGKGDLRNRLSSPVIADPGSPGGGTLRVARLKYAGAWDPEPAAWPRMARLFQQQTDVGMSLSVVDFDKLDSEAAGQPPINVAHWTGAAAYTLNPRELDAARKFLDAGGVLLVDPAGGNAEFTESVYRNISAIAPGAKIGVLPATHPILTGAGLTGADDLTTPVLRPFVRSRGGASNAGRLEVVRVGKGCILFTPLDLTHALLGTTTWAVYGYDPAYAASVVKNVLIWQAFGRPE